MIHIPFAAPDCCWIWLGSSKRGKGYAGFWLGDKNIKASRFSFYIYNGFLYNQVCHTCDNRLCVNPEHLFLGSNQDNVTDKMNKNRYKILSGELNGAAILTQEKVKQIRELKLKGITITDLSKLFGVKQSTIYSVVNKNRWKHL